MESTKVYYRSGQTLERLETNISLSNTNIASVLLIVEIFLHQLSNHDDSSHVMVNLEWVIYYNNIRIPFFCL